ncbi:GNAT family N-acetyltransferase [Actibacterium lipolyticum]|uniref:N-acetyltransferase domain-containing protein n=1 Tax=Actibacterium lipolyticum TaxID=1524263 RepID=A0A238KSG4_9RHOB|nr:GNAT family N-acetyltransferase [Actibacterium lipolyticum]SMX45600.1 hypothetical protein COL8621_02843 [Actibacterium lipolyticum]
MTLSLNFPVLETERLTLRGPEAADFEPFASFYEDARSGGFGGPLSRDKAWRSFATNIGHWALHGYGLWTVVDTASGQPCGVCGLWNPEGWPEPEIAWAIYEAFEGKGIAYEAALRVREHAYTTLGWTTVTSNIIPGNARSVALAERMGATFERAYENPAMGTDHLYRHPSAKEVRA